MGIIALVLILVIIVIFFVSKIPNLTITRKIFIVVSAFLLCIFCVVIIFITGFESGRIPKEMEIENNQKIPGHYQQNSEKENNKISIQNNHSQDTLTEVMLEKDLLFNGKLRRYFTVKEFEKNFGKADSIKLLSEEEPCSYIFDTEIESNDMNDNKYFYKDGSRFENFKDKFAVDEFRFIKNNFILYKGKKLNAATSIIELQKTFPNAVRDIGNMEVYGEGKLQVIQLREDENNISDGHINIFLKNGKLHSMHWWFPC